MEACKGLREALPLVTVTFRKKQVQLGEALMEIFNALALEGYIHTEKTDKTVGNYTVAYQVLSHFLFVTFHTCVFNIRIHSCRARLTGVSSTLSPILTYTLDINIHPLTPTESEFDLKRSQLSHPVHSVPIAGIRIRVSIRTRVSGSGRDPDRGRSRSRGRGRTADHVGRSPDDSC